MEEMHTRSAKKKAWYVISTNHSIFIVGAMDMCSFIQAVEIPVKCVMGSIWGGIQQHMFAKSWTYVDTSLCLHFTYGNLLYINILRSTNTF